MERGRRVAYLVAALGATALAGAASMETEADSAGLAWPLLLAAVLVGVLLYWSIERPRRGVSARLSQELDRRQAELHRITEHARCVVDHVVDGIITIDVEGRVEAFNPAAERIFGYQADEVLGRNLSMLMPEPHRSLHHHYVAGYLRTGQAKIIGIGREVQGLRKDGTTFPMDLAVSEYACDGQRYFVGIVRDATQRNRVAEELKSAKQAAEEANRAKSQFLANISHELRTPMNAVLGMTELALGEELPEAVRDYLRTAKDSAEVLLELLNELLDFSRIEAGRLELESAPFNLRTVIHQTLRTLSVRAGEKGLELVCDFPSDVPDGLIGDPLRLRQVLVNLLGNAIKFTERGEIVVRVGVERLKEQEVTLRIAVADTGIGIAAADQQRIFAPFTQADASTTRHYGGTGLGLTIAASLANLMGGRLKVESEPGRGSTFSFSPRFQMAPAATRNPPAPSERLRGRRVLIVDDSPACRQVLEGMLSRAGLQTESRTEATAALATAHQAAAAGDPFTLVVVDALLPGLDGLSMGAQFQGDARLARAAILMLSPAHRQLPPRGSEAPCVFFLAKPIFEEELLVAVDRALGGGLPPAPGESRSVGGPAPHPLRILLAEDTPANQKLLQSILAKRGHAVELAVNGREAVEQVRQGHFDLVLMDVQMPVMDGLQATLDIRALDDPAKARVPIVAMTAHAMKGDRARCLAAGMDSYLAKPIDRAGLIEHVEQLAAQRAGVESR